MAVTTMMMTWLWRRRKWHAQGAGGAGARQPGSKERPETGTPPLARRGHSLGVLTACSDLQMYTQQTSCQRNGLDGCLP
eukprot:8653670-Pyramimonas_sp.AAC.1